MRVLIFGATGMVGAGVLRECLSDPRVTSVLAVGRRRSGISHEKLEELEHSDFFDYSAIRDRLKGRDACFFCLGVSSAGMAESRYRHLTYDLTLAAANAIAGVNDKLTFCYVSGAGTGVNSRMMWARVKGQTENVLLGMPFKSAYMFRPGYIQPMKGIRSKTPIYQAFYTILGPLYPLLRRLAPGLVTTTETLGRAMIEVAANGYGKSVLETEDINRAGRG